MPYTPFNYNPYPYPTYLPSQRTDGQMGTVYPQPQNIAPAASVGQTQGISAMSRPVSSKEEAMAVGADFSGAPMIFPDLAHNVVFVKRWDFNTGSAVFVEYVPKGAEPEVPAVYATKGDFKELAESVEKVMARFDGIEAEFDKLKAKKGAKKNDADE